MSKFLTEYFDFRGHLSTFRAENNPKSRPFKVENNAQTLPKQLQKKLWKSPENDFFDPQNGQITDVNLAKSVDFWVHFRATSSIFGLLVSKILQKSFLLIAKDF